jgi:hypothetical protein
MLQTPKASKAQMEGIYNVLNGFLHGIPDDYGDEISLDAGQRMA